MMVVLDNLLSNAIDFSPEGGEIRLLAKHENHLLRLECMDHGPGWPQRRLSAFSIPSIKALVALLSRGGEWRRTFHCS